MTGHQARALSLLGSPEVREAFDLSQEPADVRERYGRNIHGQCVLLARRLIEHGVPLVNVNWHNDGQSFWDTHGNNFNRLKNDLIPPADRALTALLTDLVRPRPAGRHDRRLGAANSAASPQISQGNSGREHWPYCYSGLLGRRRHRRRRGVRRQRPPRRLSRDQSGRRTTTPRPSCTPWASRTRRSLRPTAGRTRSTPASRSRRCSRERSAPTSPNISANSVVVSHTPCAVVTCRNSFCRAKLRPSLRGRGGCSGTIGTTANISATPSAWASAWQPLTTTSADALAQPAFQRSGAGHKEPDRRAGAAAHRRCVGQSTALSYFSTVKNDKPTMGTPLTCKYCTKYHLQCMFGCNPLPGWHFGCPAESSLRAADCHFGSRGLPRGG